MSVTNKNAKLNSLSSASVFMRRIRHIHFVGIGGVGMSGIAEVLLTQGYQVSGSDAMENSATQHLAGLGAIIYQGHDKRHIRSVDVVVVSTAIHSDNPEVLAAREARIPVISRAQMLAELMRFRHGIAVAGTHGKTTTTSLVASVLAEGGLDPTFVIGGKLNSAGSNARLGQGHYLVAEADESDASFLLLQPMMAIVTNIDNDHMSTYEGDIAKLRQAFIDFLHHLPFYGLAIVCVDDPTIREILPEIQRPVLTYGFDESADLRIVEYTSRGLESDFTLLRQANGETYSFTLNLPGRHNVSNAVAAIAVAQEEGMTREAIGRALSQFAGIGRRFQLHAHVKIPAGHIDLIDDYGHHPTEVKAVWQTMREGWPSKRLVVVFQPHRYTRTRDLLDDFATVLATADILVVLEVYSAGESYIPGADGRALCRAIRQRGQVEPIFVENPADLTAALLPVLLDGDMVLMQGAGNIGQLAAGYVNCSEIK